MKTVIKVENLSKAYQLGTFGTGTISRDLERYWATLRGKEDPFLKIGEANDRTAKGDSDIVWSLRDVNFEVREGESLGIIGRNGAGKSTLLKILSRVTSPTAGGIKVKGRIASLLEVGTGFHPELSGRENIYLNGAILGMRKKEITRKLDEIVDFSGVERYIDTPVKRYSSGMYVRLAFAVAAHLESEILIVDEVLAVGDTEFQKKCLGKMGEVSNGDGRTVLFVSHNMGAVSQLCQKGILLTNGHLVENDTANKVVDSYLSWERVKQISAKFDLSDFSRSGNGKVVFLEAFLSRSTISEPQRIFSIGESVFVFFSMRFNAPNEQTVKTSIELKSSDGLRIAHMIDVDSSFQIIATINDTALYEVVLHDVRLYPGMYFLSLYCGDMSSSEVYDHVEDCLSFEVINGGRLTNRPLPRSAGLLFLTPEWKKISSAS